MFYPKLYSYFLIKMTLLVSKNDQSIFRGSLNASSNQINLLSRGKIICKNVSRQPKISCLQEITFQRREIVNN